MREFVSLASPVTAPSVNELTLSSSFIEEDLINMTSFSGALHNLARENEDILSREQEPEQVTEANTKPSDEPQQTTPQGDKRKTKPTMAKKTGLNITRPVAIKRKKKLSKVNIDRAMTRSSLRRLARRGGVKRISTPVLKEIREVLTEFLKRTINDSLAYMEHSKRKTVSVMDVIYALKNQNMHLYGFN